MASYEDRGQIEVNNIFKDKISAPFKIPVLYITQLIGLAMGMDPESIGMVRKHELGGVPPFIPIDPILTKLGEGSG